MIDDDDSPKMGEWTVPAGLNRRTSQFETFKEERRMNEQTKTTIEGLLLASFLGMREIADRVGVSVADVREVMMAMPPVEFDNDE